MSAHDRWYLVGVDLGQASDPTAIAVAEALPTVGRLRLRHLERLPLDTPYPDVVRRVRRITALPEVAGRCHVVVDATGGRAVVDLLRRARLQAALLPVVATRGKRESQVPGYFRVPKRKLILGLQSMLAGGLLDIAYGLRDRVALFREFDQVERRVSRCGSERFGSWRTGQHDDLVFAVALACWAGSRIVRATLRQTVRRIA